LVQFFLLVHFALAYDGLEGELLVGISLAGENLVFFEFGWSVVLVHFAVVVHAFEKFESVHLFFRFFDEILFCMGNAEMFIGEAL